MLEVILLFGGSDRFCILPNRSFSMTDYLFGHRAFLRLGNSLEECARKYKGFCQKYKPQEKAPTKCHWGSKLLGGVHLFDIGSTTHPKSKTRFVFPRCRVEVEKRRIDDEGDRIALEADEINS